MDDRLETLALAERVAAEAGAALAARRASWAQVEGEEGREVKIAGDRAAEALISAALSARSPWPILSEERGWAGAANLARFWAVDPLDGSVNYAQGYPHCAVSIALVEDGAPALGVVDCFLLGERFTGAVGAGAWVNGAPMRVSSVADPARGVLNTGIPARMATDAPAQARLLARLMAWRKVRMLGSAAAALAYVAAGRADAYCENGSMIWDVAAGCALVSAAGGQIRLSGADLTQPLDVSATNGIVPFPN